MFCNFQKNAGKKRNFLNFIKGRYFLLRDRKNIIFSQFREALLDCIKNVILIILLGKGQSYSNLNVKRN